MSWVSTCLRPRTARIDFGQPAIPPMDAWPDFAEVGNLGLGWFSHYQRERADAALPYDSMAMQ